MTALLTFIKALFATLGAFFSGECVGELKQAQKQSQEDEDALIKANNNADSVDVMSDDDIRMFLNTKHSLRYTASDPKPD